jgi:hypothetical protein
MLDALEPAAALVDRLGGRADLGRRSTVGLNVEGGHGRELPPRLTAARMEMRQIAGISAGGRFELRPGHYEFGPTTTGAGRLDEGDPDEVGFELIVDQGLTAFVTAAPGAVTLDGVPVTDPVPVGDAVIDAGSARFVVARPRPMSNRRSLATRPSDRHVAHLGPDEVIHRIEADADRGDRPVGHRLFGTALVGWRAAGQAKRPTDPAMAVDLLGSPTVIAGRSSLRSALVRQMVLTLAVTCNPVDLAIELRSDDQGLAPLAALAHCQPDVRPFARHRLVVAEHTSTGRGRPLASDSATQTLTLVDRTVDDADWAADVVRLIDESTLELSRGGEGPNATRAIPIGMARSLTADLVDRLAQRSDSGT